MREGLRVCVPAASARYLQPNDCLCLSRCVYVASLRNRGIWEGFSHDKVDNECQ